MSEKKSEKGIKNQNLEKINFENTPENQKDDEKNKKNNKKYKRLISDVVIELLNSKPGQQIAEKAQEKFGIEYQKIDNQMLIVLAQLEKAMAGDAKAFEILRDTAGQKPVAKNENENEEINKNNIEPLKIIVQFKEDNKNREKE